MSMTKGFLGFLIGGAVGGAAALLFAPKKGSEVRGDIKTNFDDIINQAKEKGRNIFNRSLDIVDDIVKKSNELRNMMNKVNKGNYKGPIDNAEREINRQRTALFAAIDTYRNSKNREKSSDELVNNIYDEFENEAVPSKTQTIH